MDLTLILGAAAALTAVGLLSRAVIVGRPDEWVLQIRDGRCVRAGVGVVVLRRPLDTVVRFSSAVQRVSFTASALTTDLVETTIRGYVLWSISPEGEAPFVAFRRLGLDGGGAANPNRHLLSKPQHRAFQTAIAAAAQSRASSFTFAELALDQGRFVERLAEACRDTMGGMGVQVDEVQVVEVHATSELVQGDLTAPAKQRIHEDAETARVASDQRLRALKADAETQAARKETESLRARESDRLAAELELEAERAQLDVARGARSDAELAAKLRRLRQEAEAEAERARLLAAAEEEKSQALRDFELARLRTTELAAAFKSLPVQDARWYTLGSPLDTLSKLLDQVN
jgi:hypothetical protein